jgi:hypothetical protein
MPLDSGGKFRHNTQVAGMHSKMNSGERSKAKEEILGGKSDGGEEGGHTEVHNHGDGTFHTVHDGKEEQHETIGHLHAHLSMLHGAPGEKHFHGHSDGMMHHSHAGETGQEHEHRDHESEDGIHEHAAEHFGAGEQAQSHISDGDGADSEAGSALGY